MEIETQELTTCEVAADGCAISLGFVDSRGEPATIRLSVNQVGALVMTLPGADQQGAADPLRRPEPALRLSARFLGNRAIHRSETWHDDVKNERRLQRLLLDPARAAKRTRRSVDGSCPESDDTVELAAMPRQLRMGDRRANNLRNQAHIVKLRR
jgi:hypothetical protein